MSGATQPKWTTIGWCMRLGEWNYELEPQEVDALQLVIADFHSVVVVGDGGWYWFLCDGVPKYQYGKPFA